MAVVLAIEYPILFFKFHIEDISSLVTENVGKEETLDEVECKGSGILVIRVITTEKSALGGPAECKGKNSTFIKVGANSAMASLETSILFKSIVDRE